MAALTAPRAVRAAELGDVHGIVHDAEHRPLPAAHVELKAAAADWTQRTVTGPAGEFSFSGVPLGKYLLTVGSTGYAGSTLFVTVLPGSAPSTHVQLTAAEALETVTVSAMPAPPSPAFTPSALVDRADIRMTPGADRSNSLSMITDYVPGAYLVHDQLHVRGGHQVTWEIDGVEIPNTNIASNLGPQIDPKDVDYLQAERGGYGAAEGDRTYGVFNLVPRTGFERNDEAELSVSAGNFSQTNDHLSIGSHTDRFAYYASLAGNRSDSGLMTPDARILHDSEEGYGGFATLLYNLTPEDQLRVVLAARRDAYQIPNLPRQIAGDVQREADTYAILSWVRTLSSAAALRSSLFYHYNRADYDGAAWDYPISTTARRSSGYLGLEESLHWSRGANSVDAGLYAFAQEDEQRFSVSFNDGSYPAFQQALVPRGDLEVGWLQDTVHFDDWITVSAGARASRFAGRTAESALDPRLGASFKFPRLGMLLHAFWGKFYQPPPLQTIAGPLLQYAQSSALAVLPLHGERDEEYQLGLTVPLAGWTLDLNRFRTRSRNFFDHNPIGSSNVFLPITISGALIAGNELTVRSPRFGTIEQLYVTFSNQTADGVGAITGGLTDFAPPQGYYALDHDQRNTLNAGIRAELPLQAYLSLNLYFGSGFANGHPPPTHLASHGTLDVAVGKSLGGSLAASLTVLNVTDKHLLIDNSLTFDGLHWNEPRQIYGEVHYRFRY